LEVRTEKGEKLGYEKLRKAGFAGSMAKRRYGDVD
jgi:hypothetical protein